MRIWQRFPIFISLTVSYLFIYTALSLSNSDFLCPQIQRLSFSNQLEVPRVHPLWNLWIFIQRNHILSNIAAWSGHLYFGPTLSIVQGLTGLFLASIRSFSWFPLRHSLSVWKPAILLWFPAALLSSGPWDMVHTSPLHSHVHNNKLWPTDSRGFYVLRPVATYSLFLTPYGKAKSWEEWINSSPETMAGQRRYGNARTECTVVTDWALRHAGRQEVFWALREAPKVVVKSERWILPQVVDSPASSSPSKFWASPICLKDLVIAGGEER